MMRQTKKNHTHEKQITVAVIVIFGVLNTTSNFEKKKTIDFLYMFVCTESKKSESNKFFYFC